MSEVCIILSTFNGEKYLNDFLNSLSNQTYKDWVLFVRDDGSVDNTLSILEDFKKKTGKLFILEEPKHNLGACKSFFALLTNIPNFKYYAFADQDDVWLDFKLEESLNTMKELENTYGECTPLLVHTDLKVVDKDLKTISDSFWRYQNINPYKNSLNYLILQNTITGCTMLINNSLRDFIKSIPNKAIMHDWWLGLMASAFGKIKPIEKSTVLYRQHSSNDTGAKGYSASYFINRFLKEKKK